MFDRSCGNAVGRGWRSAPKRFDPGMRDGVRPEKEGGEGGRLGWVELEFGIGLGL